MITVKLGQLVERPKMDRVSKVLERIVNAELKIDAAFRVPAIIRQIDQHINDFRTQLEAVYKKYGTFNAETKEYTVQTDTPGFTDELNTLLNLTVEIKGERLTRGDFAPEANIRPQDLHLASWLVDVGDTENNSENLENNA